MAEPTNYDLIQDDRLDQLESLITAEYQPPAGVEYSFPVANQGITQEQFRLMHLGQANGIIHGDNGTVNDSPDSTGYRYYLDGHSSDSETNQRNTLILRAGTSAEAIVEGFYHRLTEDMELPFPPVTTTTVYHVTITYDPRDFKTSPLRIQVYPGEPPTSHGRVHLILHTVERQPNQLLSQATITRYRHYTAGVVSMQNENQLPDPTAFPAGTLAVPSAAGRGIYVRGNTAMRWENPIVGPWITPSFANGFDSFAPFTVQYRRTSLGVQFKGRLRTNTATSLAHRITTLPSSLGVGAYRQLIGTSSSQVFLQFEVATDGVVSFSSGTPSTTPSWASLDGIIIPYA